MLRPNVKALASQEWAACLETTALDTRRRVALTAQASASEVANAFYDALLADPRAGTMLDHAVVNARLHASMARWVTSLFDPQVTPERHEAVQRHTGEVHARIGVPIDLLARGAREVKRALAARLADEHMPARQLAEAVQFVYEMVDIAIGRMAAATAADADRAARTDEAYRLHFLSQDLSAERERQRSRLLEWAHQILFRNYWQPEAATASPVSEFSLWLEHKASILFEGAPEIDEIRAHIATIEGELLPRLVQARADPDGARAVVAGIHVGIAEVKALLSSLFDRFAAAEDGRDPLTPRLLSRRYFPSVARREIAHAMQAGTSFALVLCDLDGFEGARESLGSAAADLLLGVAADALAEHVRAGDFVFRIGDDQFLLLLVEVPPADLMAVVEGLRLRIEQAQPRAAMQAGVPLQASFGVALFDGHPDYQRLLERATNALRLAQQQGGNRCELAA